MSLRNTPLGYGSIARWFHWTTAILFIFSYSTVYYRRWFTEPKTPENWEVLQLHLSIGATIFVIVLLRIIWQLKNVRPDPEPGAKYEHLLAQVGHILLYVMMLVMPIVGYLGTGANTEFFSLFEIPKFENTWLFQSIVFEQLDMSFSEFEKIADFIHKDFLGDWVVWILILGHIIAAMYHTIIKKDKTLQKMI